MSTDFRAEPASPERPTIDGIPNFRSLAGLSTADGRRIRDGVLYRSEALTGLSELAQHQVAELGIGSVCDLRSAGEAARAHPWNGPVRNRLLSRSRRFPMSALPVRT